MSLTLAALALLAGTAPAQPERVTLQGQVVDRESGQPVSGAQVMLPDARRAVDTGPEGLFVLRDVPVGAQTFAVSQIGYLRIQTVLQVGPAGDSLTVRLQRDPILLEALEVQVDRLESRRNRSALSSRAFDERDLALYRRPDPVAFLQDHTGMRPAACGGLDTRWECAWIRGEPARVNVVIDERFQLYGLADLRSLTVQEIYRMEVYRGGSLVVVYTKPFVQQLARGNVPLHSVEAFLRIAEARALTHYTDVSEIPGGT